MIFQHQDFANFLWNLYKFVKICFFFCEVHLFPYAQVHLNTFLICACASLFYSFCFACVCCHRDKDIVRLVPSRLKPGNKSTRSVLPFKLRLRSLSWNRTIGPDAERLCSRLSTRHSPSLGHLSFIDSAFAVAPPLKCHALKCCTSWRESCLASVFACARQSAG